MSGDNPNPTVVHLEGEHEESFEETEANKKEWECHRLGFFTTAALAEIAIVILFGTCTRYGDVAAGSNTSDPASEDLHQYYPVFQDVNVMIFVGFGFLMTFLHKYGYSSVGLNFVVAALSVQVSILLSGFWERVWENSASGPHPGHGFDEPLEMSIIVLIKSLFAAAAVLISMGACLGKTTPSQLLVMAILELFFFGLNETIVAYYLRAVDMGGSMVVHTFGAYFGLAVSRVVSRADTRKDEHGHIEEVGHKDDRSSKTSDMFAMVGTLFLWMFWPSFNGALAGGDQQQRVAINTFLALAACACAAFAADNLMRPGRKFDMVSIQNATLAGGVAVGSSADLVIQPWGAILVGLIAGTLSVVGYVHIQPCLAKAIGLHDTCGVHNLHGMPGILGGITGAVSAAFADSALGQYVSESQIEGIFAARAPCQTDPSLPDWNPEPCGLDASGQASQQAFGLLCTIAMAIVTGIISGFVVKLPCLLPPGHGCNTYCQCGNGLSRKLWFDDRHYWEVPESEEEEGDHEEIVVVKAAQVENDKAVDVVAGDTEEVNAAGPEGNATGSAGSIPHFEIVRSS